MGGLSIVTGEFEEEETDDSSGIARFLLAAPETRFTPYRRKARSRRLMKSKPGVAATFRKGLMPAAGVRFAVYSFACQVRSQLVELSDW